MARCCSGALDTDEDDEATKRDDSETTASKEAAEVDDSSGGREAALQDLLDALNIKEQTGSFVYRGGRVL